MLDLWLEPPLLAHKSPLEHARLARLPHIPLPSRTSVWDERLCEWSLSRSCTVTVTGTNVHFVNGPGAPHLGLYELNPLYPLQLRSIMVLDFNNSLNKALYLEKSIELFLKINPWGKKKNTVILRKLEVIYVSLSFSLSNTGNFNTLMQHTGKIWGLQNPRSPSQPGMRSQDCESICGRKPIPRGIENDPSPTYLVGAQTSEFRRQKEEPEGMAFNEGWVVVSLKSSWKATILF